MALASNVHPKTVSEMLGHAHISITLQTYSHVTPSMHKQAVDVIASALGA